MNRFRPVLFLRATHRSAALTWRGAGAGGGGGVLPRPRSTCRRAISSSSSPAPGLDEGGRQWSTPLAKKLATAMEALGPMPLARYMRMCLTSDQGGYYTRGGLQDGQDQFGVKGDFVTAPEISQIFGEMVGLWFVMQWMKQGEGKSGATIEIIEAGPGRGTLMADMLRIFHRFDMTPHIDAIYMVEASAQLREAQKNLLCGPDAPMTESKVGYHSICKHTNLPIVWTQAIQSIPKNTKTIPFIVAHEFFDALPIHAFQGIQAAPSEKPAKYEKETPSKDGTPNRVWRELIVAPVPTQPKLGQADPEPEFQLSLAKEPTRHSQSLPLSSARYRALKSVPDAVIEICPDASLYAADFAARIGGSSTFDKRHPSGAALIIDYGPKDTVPINSLRGIRRHHRVSPFAEPGLVDLSADVDFTAIAQAATRASEGIEVWGPVEQEIFLKQMGVRQRAEQLMKGKTEERAKEIDASWKRLVDVGPGGMGKVYKAMAIVPDEDGKHPPPGFGRDLAAEEGH